MCLNNAFANKIYKMYGIYMVSELNATICAHIFFGLFEINYFKDDADG